MDRSDGWSWGLPPFPSDERSSDMPASGYGKTDPIPLPGMPSSSRGTPGYGAPFWACDLAYDQPPIAGLTFTEYHPSSSYSRALVPESVYPGQAPMRGAAQAVMPLYSYSMRGESSRAGGSHEETVPVGRMGHAGDGVQEAGRHGDSPYFDSAAAWQFIREAHEGHLASSKEVSRSQADVAHYSAQLGAAHEALTMRDAEIANLRQSHVAELDSARWEDFVNGMVDMLRANPHMYLCTSFLLNHRVPPEVLAVLEPYIALVPPPGPIMNFLVNGVLFSAGAHPSGVGSVDSVAGGAGGHVLPASPFVAADYYVPDLSHIAPADDEAEDSAAGEDETGDEATDDDDHPS